MNQSPASSQVSTPPTTTSSSNFKVIFEKALKAYQKTTNQDLTVHPLANQLQVCDSPVAILTILQGHVDQFIRSRSGDERLKNWLSPTISVLYAFSATLGEGVGLVFSPAKVIFAGAGVLLLAAKDVEASQDILIDVFERVENFFRRLENYTDVPLTPAMTDMMVKIMIKVLDILGTATKEMQQSRAKQFLKKVAGIRELEDGLNMLDKMTNEEARMANAEVLKVAHDIDKKVKVVEEMVQMVIDDGKEAAMETKIIMQQTAHNLDDVKRWQLRECLRKWQSPPDPSTNHNIACERQHEGTAKWFCQGSVFEEWKVAAGSGKSILCSAIIQDITTLHDAGSASMAYFYFDFRNIEKRSRHKLLPSLLVQLATCSDSFCDVLSRLYEAHDHGARQPSDSALLSCLKEMLTLPDQAPVYLILDALDECLNTSGVPSSREQVLGLVKELVGLRLPSLHICVTSRAEVDIQDTLESLVSHSVSLHDESGQRKDIEEYIRSVVYCESARAQKRWRDADKDLIIETLSERADGMFRWVFCQLETLRHCLPQNIPRILKELPASLDETYERMLKEIGTANRDHTYRLLQCLTVAIRPLHVEELAEILALDFDGAKEGIPELKEDWRWKDQQEAVLSTCSSLIAIVGDGSHRVVQFSHFSVKEFLTSDRLATSSADVSHFHIVLEPAHTVIVKACLGILLRSDNGVGDAKAKSNSPLAKYAARHWVEHAQFENLEVSTHLQVGMRPLFDPAMPYFEAWLELYDVDDQGWNGFTVYDKQRGSSLYYASLCGFRDLVAHLVVNQPQDVNATLGRYFSPLVAALHKKHFDIAELLYQNGADVGIRGYENRTLLHAASVGGFVDISQWLLDHCADAHLQQDNYKTLLHLVETSGRLGHCKSVDVADDINRTPLHLASLRGHFDIAQLLIEHGAEVTSQDRWHWTPLHLASSSGSAEAVRVLIEHGADVNARDGSRSTPLHLSLSPGSPETVRVLIEHGADVNSRDGSHNTLLHLASSSRSPGIVRLLIEHGADVNARDWNYEMPLHLALSSRSLETVRVLVEHGADVNARDGSNRTPLHLVSSSRRAKTVRILIEHGADVNALDGSRNTSLHLALSSGSAETVRVLVEHGADVNARGGGHRTPLHLALSSQNPEVVQVLIEHGADVNARNGSNKTPLHLASSQDEEPPMLTAKRAESDERADKKADIVRVLIENGADVTAQDDTRSTPLHLASSKGSGETVKLLLKHGADVDAQDTRHLTPLHWAAASRLALEGNVVQLLLGHSANVDAKDERGRTPFQIASSKGLSGITDLLSDYQVGKE